MGIYFEQKLAKKTQQKWVPPFPENGLGFCGGPGREFLQTKG